METIVVRAMRTEDARDFLETHSASIRGIASADYPANVIEGWALPVTEKRIEEFLENPDDEFVWSLNYMVP